MCEMEVRQYLEPPGSPVLRVAVEVAMWKIRTVSLSLQSTALINDERHLVTGVRGREAGECALGCSLILLSYTYFSLPQQQGPYNIVTKYNISSPYSSESFVSTLTLQRKHSRALNT